MPFGHLPGESDGGRELLVARAEPGFARSGSVEDRNLSGERARLEQVADAGDAPHAGIAGTGVDAVVVDRRILTVPAHAVVEGQARVQSPGILEVEADFALVVAHDGLKGAVLFALFIRHHAAIDGRNAAGEQGVQRRRIGLHVGGVGAGEIGGGEHVGRAGDDRVAGGRAEGDGRDDLGAVDRGGPGVELGEAAAEIEQVRGHGVGEVDVALLERRVAAGLAGGAVGVGDEVRSGGAKGGSVAAPLVEIAGVDAVVEDHGAADEAEADLADQARGERGAQRRDGGERDTALVAVLGAVEHVAGAGEDRAGGADVHAIGPADVGLIVPDELEVMLLGDVVVHARGGEAPVVAALTLEIQVVAVVVGIGGDAALQARDAIGQGSNLLEALQEDADPAWRGNRWRRRAGRG